MDYCEFQDLDDRGRAFAVWKYGVFLLSRKAENMTYKLYGLGDFFVELCQSDDDQFINTLRSSLSAKILEPYLDQISLDPLSEILRSPR